FNRMKYLPYLRREMIRTLAGLKTGLFTSAPPGEIADPLGRGLAERLNLPLRHASKTAEVD
ncbi:hypothetical protein, partial [Acinetobacter baumannii]|uniref:hypothetical protein n=1 Tax=Acinetobacter baumannii TaxID=470 RepID=UPI0013D76640